MSDKVKLRLLESKRDAYFARVQRILDSTKSLTTERLRKAFVAQAEQIDGLRSEFNGLMDEINMLNLTLDPTCEVSYGALHSFDELVGEIKFSLSSLTESRDFQKPSPSASPNTHHIQVPKIELPTFDGDIQSFPFFYETFKRIIHTNADLADSDRIHYLVSCLKGKARNVAEGIVPSGDNYLVVWEALIAKYLDTRALATNYLNQLFSLKSFGSTPANIEKGFDKLTSTVAGLKQLKINNLDDFIFIHWGLKLIDSDIAKHFEMSLRNQQELDYDYFVKFVREQVKILYRTSPAASKSAPAGSPRASSKESQVFVATESKCSLCHSTHKNLFMCKAFQKLSVDNRFKFIKDNNRCGNCLSSQHTVSKCLSKSTCRKCNGKHHSLLHFEKSTQAPAPTPASAPTSTSAADPAASDRVALCTHSSAQVQATRSTEVLATAKVLVAGRKGKAVVVRCLLDPGSQKNYMTSRCCRMLGLTIHTDSITTVRGIGGTSQPVRGSVNITFSSRFCSQPRYEIDALVLDQITGQLPLGAIDTSVLNHIDPKLLADDSWGVPGNIDLLLGVKLFAKLLRPGPVTSVPGCPDALETVLGYILLGEAPIIEPPTDTLSFFASSVDNFDLRKFWEIEDVTASSIGSVDDKHCEEFYCSTITRAPNGKYVAALPLKTEASALGNSFNMARKRFYSLERKLKSLPNVKLLYDDVIRDYLKNNYISLVQNIVPECTLPKQNCKEREMEYYIPHHAVIREDKVTTKLRVVLDASACTDNGTSLNDILYAGPVLQADLFNILLNFRLFCVAVSADVKSMYLRIGIRSQDRSLQRILYRFNEEEELQIYQFSVLPFGLKCSPFIAIRTIQQLCQDEGTELPLARDILQRDIYMDDIVSSIPSSALAIDSARELIKIFSLGDFQLTKWSSNSVDVLRTIPESLRLSQSVDLSKNPTQKILGLHWFPDEDCFVFQVNPDVRTCTKRNILSSIARLFDVLGLVAPIILYAKLLIKELWLVKLGWDDVPPPRIVRLWEQFQSELPIISELRFLRHVGVVERCRLSLVGFADASEKAYGGSVYAHVVRPDGSVVVSLVCAKSKVAPLKVVSLARLELCAALLLSTVIKRVYNLFAARHAIEVVVAFSDSTVTLSWIHSAPHRWHTFVANRIAKIHENLSADHFFHVKGSENPSDCLSRGLTPAQLVHHPLWLNGPSWLKLPRAEWPIKPFVSGESQELPEMKPVALPVLSHECSDRSPPSDNILYVRSTRFSSWSKYLKTICLVYKFIKRLPRGPVTASDLEFAESMVWRSVQKIYFESDLDRLARNELCSKPVQRLSPFLHEGLIHVGGRLANSELDFDSRHQILLPRLDHIVELLVSHYHVTNFHTGPTLLVSLLRQKYWILSARRIARHITFKCNICFRAKPRPIFPIMADLPRFRVESAPKAFSHTGCDYAGPFLVTSVRARGQRARKAYICLFTCLTTRALHLEIASDLSTASFLSALKRFLARRGPVQCLYTDNATNFIGAKSYLRDLYQFLAKEYHPLWERELAEHRITLKNIPCRAPHFGGCWESEVKSVKTHLCKVIGQQILSFDEFNTMLTQVEALLNSRPLYAISSDPSEPTSLSPAHFLHTKPLLFLPAREVNETRLHLISRYELTDQMVQSFWKRWRQEYLHTLQSKQKWNTPANPIRVGMVVVSMQDNVMPLHWPLGVIHEIFPDKNGVCRVASVKTQDGILRSRPVVKLCPLPTQ